MDSRTYLDTKVAGYELDRKRQVAAEARRARAAQQGGEHLAGSTIRGGRLARIWNRAGGFAMWSKVKGAVARVLLAAMLLAPMLRAPAAWSPAAGALPEGSRWSCGPPTLETRHLRSVTSHVTAWQVRLVGRDIGWHSAVVDRLID